MQSKREKIRTVVLVPGSLRKRILNQNFFRDVPLLNIPRGIALQFKNYSVPLPPTPPSSLCPHLTNSSQTTSPPPISRSPRTTRPTVNNASTIPAGRDSCRFSPLVGEDSYSYRAANSYSSQPTVNKALTNINATAKNRTKNSARSRPEFPSDNRLSFLRPQSFEAVAKLCGRRKERRLSAGEGNSGRERAEFLSSGFVQDIYTPFTHQLQTNYTSDT